MTENIMADHSTANSAACRVADPFRGVLVGLNFVGSSGMAIDIRLYNNFERAAAVALI
jgi:hypothetical protein